MSDLERNKEVARVFVESMSNLDSTRFLGVLSEDLIFETIGSTAASGKKTKAEIAMLFPSLRKALPDGVKLRIIDLTAEQDRVSCRVSGEAITGKGTAYNNQYCFALTIRNGKILNVVEYTDTALIEKVLVPAFYE